MTIDQQLAIDNRVRRGFGVARGQTIDEVAKRIAASGLHSRATFAARVLLDVERRPEAWDRMAAAARILGREEP